MQARTLLFRNAGIHALRPTSNRMVWLKGAADAAVFAHRLSGIVRNAPANP
jgi:hypothetical protein